MDRLALDARTLMVAARAAGLVVVADGDRLCVRGPRIAAGLARLLIDHKAAVLALLRAEPGPAGPPEGPAAVPQAPAPSPPPWPPRPRELAGWPVEWRARWGLLANALEDQGITWPAHERIAFDQIKAEIDAAPQNGLAAEHMSAPS
jgi:hypothetical protein